MMKTFNPGSAPLTPAPRTMSLPQGGPMQLDGFQKNPMSLLDTDFGARLLAQNSAPKRSLPGPAERSPAPFRPAARPPLAERSEPAPSRQDFRPGDPASKKVIDRGEGQDRNDSRPAPTGQQGAMQDARPARPAAGPGSPGRRDGIFPDTSFAGAPESTDAPTVDTEWLPGTPVMVIPGAIAPEGPQAVSDENWVLLRQDLGGREGLLQRVPALALLNGRVELLEPAGIPSLVTGNTFIKTALENMDAEAFMSQPLTIGDIFRALEMDDRTLAMAESLGIDLEGMTTPGEFLRSIGMDTQQIAAEFTLLRQNLRTGGLQPYMDRSGNLRRSLGIDAPEKEPGISTPVAATAAMPLGEGIRPGTPAGGWPAGMEPGPLSTQDPGLSQPRNADGSFRQAISPELSPGPVGTRAPTPGERQAVPTGKGDIPAMMAPVVSKDPYDSFATRMENPAVVRPGPTANQPLSQPVADKAFFVESMADNSPLATLERAMLETGANTPAKGTPVMPWMVRAAAGQTVQPDPGQVTPDTAPGETADLMNGMPYATAPGKAATAVPAFSGPNQSTVVTPGTDPSAGSRDAGRLLAVPLPPTTSQGRDQQGSGAQQRDSGSSLARQSFEPVQNPAGPGRMAGVATRRSAFAESLASAAPAPRSALTNRVLEHAKIMMAKGGGSLSIDLNSEKFGQMEMAVRLNQDQLELRILTPSEQARDILVREMGDLKQALAQHDLNLKQVEVSVGGGQERTFLSSDGSFSRQQQWQQHAESRSGNTFSQESSSSRHYQSSRPMMQARTSPIHNGRIQVLA